MTSTRSVPLLVPDSGVRYPSDVFTGDGRRTLTSAEVGEILGCSANNVGKMVRAGRLVARQSCKGGGYRIDIDVLEAFVTEMHRHAERHGPGCSHSQPALSHPAECECVACHCGDDHTPGGFLGTCQRCGRPLVVDGKVVR